MRPASALDLTLEPSSSHSLRLEYKIPSQLEDFPPGLVSAIRYRSKFDSSWKEVDTTHFDLKKTSYNVELEDLLPSVEYNVEVRLLSGVVSYANHVM